MQTRVLTFALILIAHVVRIQNPMIRKNKGNIFLRLFALTLAASALVTSSLSAATDKPTLPETVLENDAAVLTTAALQKYVAQFNSDDEELYANIPNKDALTFLNENIPLFECPDKEFERTWYFRWWTYRKHVKKTPDGYVITEFLPRVGWSGKHNTISCPAGHHFYEGRWMRNPTYLDDYAVFWLRKGGSPRRYSFWIADALYARYLVRPDRNLIVDLLDDLIKNYAAWEKSHRGKEIMFHQIDDRDGMEVAIGGSGYRPTINSYMYGDAVAIAKIATLAGRKDLAKEFQAKAAEIKELVQTKLWDSGAEFFKVLPRGQGKTLVDVRELHGYTPWYFNLPDDGKGYEVAWKQLMDPKGFYAPFGPTTAEQRHPRFTISYSGHECQWNGPSWPMATAVTLTAFANLMNNSQQKVMTKQDYFKILKCYTRSHAFRDQKLAVKSGRIDKGKSAGPRSSNDQAEPRHTWWSPETLGTTQWVQYEFSQPVRADSVDVYWFSDGRGCAIPKQWRILYRDGKAWKAVSADRYGRDKDAYNHSKFQAVESTAFRIEATATDGKSAGILEWRLLSGGKNLAATASASASFTDKYGSRPDNLRSTAPRKDHAVVSTGELHAPDNALLNSLTRRPWIDENLNPYTGDWISRTRLKSWKDGTWSAGKGGKERGKDYNHSSYNDLIITGLVGLRPNADNVVKVNPLLPPDTWDYFCLDNLPYHGRRLTIIWDKTGERYGKGAGLKLFSDGREIASAKTLSPISTELD